MSMREAIWQDLQGLSDEKLLIVSEFVTFLKCREMPSSSPALVDFKRNGETRSPRMTEDEKEKYLNELLAGITEENLHPEINTGPSVGNEAW